MSAACVNASDDEWTTDVLGVVHVGDVRFIVLISHAIVRRGIVTLWCLSLTPGLKQLGTLQGKEYWIYTEASLQPQQ